MSTRRAASALVTVLGVACLAPACSSGFATIPLSSRIAVTLTGGNAGTDQSRLPITFTTPSTYTVNIVAQKPDGATDTSFNGFVRASIQPGEVLSVEGPGASGRNVQLTAGVANNVNIDVIGVYGNARILLEDIGYVPADPLRNPPPQCSDGKDNNGNGLIDFPADPGCAFANDDTEDGGTFAAGATETLFFSYPRIEDVRGASIGGTRTTFPFDQVNIDTGFRGVGVPQPFSVYLTRIASSGFYVSDLQQVTNPDGTVANKARDYGSLYAFTLSPPPLIRICDTVRLLSGTSSDFFGFTELGYPAYQVQEWDETQPCPIPDPHVLSLGEYNDNPSMFKVEAALVRLMATPGAPAPDQQPDCRTRSPFPCNPVEIHEGALLGPGFPSAANNYAPTADATNCDFDGNGKIAFDGGPEQICVTMCNGGTLPDGTLVPTNTECSEYSSYAGQGNIMLSATDLTMTPHAPQKVQVNASASGSYDALAMRGKSIYSFTGTVSYFSGGTQWTIEARCDQDIITTPNTPPVPTGGLLDPKNPTSLACVQPRSLSDPNQTTP